MDYEKTRNLKYIYQIQANAKKNNDYDTSQYYFINIKIMLGRGFNQRKSENVFKKKNKPKTDK